MMLLSVHSSNQETNRNSIIQKKTEPSDLNDHSQRTLNLTTDYKTLNGLRDSNSQQISPEIITA